MAHLKRYGQHFNVNIEKLKNLKKIGLLAHPEVSLSRIVSPQKAGFRAFFLENHYSDPFRSNYAPQVLFMAGKLWISSLWWYKEKDFLQPVEQSVTFVKIWTRTNIRIYSFQIFDSNEYPNIFA